MKTLTAAAAWASHSPRSVALWAEGAFRGSNPDASIVITWTRVPRLVKYPTGLRGYTGEFTAQAPGYKPRTLTVTLDAEGGMVR